MVADHRYLQAWKKPSSSSSYSSAPSSASRSYDTTSYQEVLPTTDPSAPSESTKTSYQVRLDTPGGVTYAPDVLSPHNSVKRLFMPSQHVARQSNYDFANEILTRQRKTDAAEAVTAAVQEAEEQSRPTDAQAYAASIDMLINPPSHELDNVKHATLTETLPDAVGEEQEENGWRTEYAKGRDTSSLLTTDTAATTHSISSHLTAMTLAAASDGSLPLNVASNAVVAKSKLPPSVAGDGTGKKPWMSTEWSSHRALDRPSEREKLAGITNFEDISGYGRIPSLQEAEVGAPTHDGASTRTARTAATNADARDLQVRDLFVPDPRPWRPLRYVRKVDPRQLLLLCAGTTLTTGQVAANRLRGGRSDGASVLSTNTTRTATPTTGSATLTHQAAWKSMMNFGKMPDYRSLENQLATATSSTVPAAEDVHGGLGFVFCPPVDPSSSDKHRSEANFSRRLERPPEFAMTTKKRAGLRSVLAALEYQKWEEEGFDKIVIATHHRWIVDGISRDIWEWRHNNWRLTREGPLGIPGETVPDKDLWELLDGVVKKYEEIDCTVRFWYIPRTENMQAFHLAEEGALKDNQQQGTVRWTKPKEPKV